MRILLTATLYFFLCSFVAGQTCTAPGQNPSTAFPVCGISTFTQTSVPICGGKQVPAPTCNTYPLTDVNPFWYKFTCFQSGTLGFTISPHTNSEDYDWELFDITGQSPNAVYTNVNIVVACNWSGEGGKTGSSNLGSKVFVCEGYGQPLWSKMPNIIQGHEYLLLVSHFTQTQSGYDLSFGGGTAVITDSTQPKLKYAEANCGGDVVRIKLNKKMKCSSVASDGSDFYITPGNISVTGASAINCSNGFDTDSIELHLSSFLAPGIYDLNVRKGSDANTVLDYCDQPIPETDKTSFQVFPLLPTPMDSIVPLACKPQSLRLVFRKPMLCSTVAGDGSDFMVMGSYPVTVTGASGNCANGASSSKEIIISLSQPLYREGNFIITLRKGTDGNTIRDECNQETSEGSSLNFTSKDTVNADFTYKIGYDCETDTVNFFIPDANGISHWQWNLDENKTSNLQNPQALYKIFNAKQVTLIVSNGVCTDTSSQSFALNNFLKVDFDAFSDVCPNEPTKFTSLATGRIVSHHWDFGDGTSASQQSPSHIYAPPNATTPYYVKYTVTDSFGCVKTVQKTIKVYSSCYLAVPNAFTPNGDGKNDFLYPLNAIKAEKLRFKVYDRWGQLIFETNDWKHGWDGTFKGIPQPSGLYVWFLTYIDRDTKESRQMKGTAALIR